MASQGIPVELSNRAKFHYTRLDFGNSVFCSILKACLIIWVTVIMDCVWDPFTLACFQQNMKCFVQRYVKGMHCHILIQIYLSKCMFYIILQL